MGFFNQISEIISNLFGFVQPVYLIVYLVVVGAVIALAVTKKISYNLASTVAVLPLGVYLLVFMVMGVKVPIDQQTEIDNVEKKIIAKLTLIRDIQEELAKQKGMYAGKSEELINFFKNGKIPIVEKKEKDLGNDSVIVKIDTLQIISTKERILNRLKEDKAKAKTQIQISHIDRMIKFANDIENIAVIPSNGGKQLKFEWFADTIRKGGVLVPVFEVKDAAPINPKRGGEFDPAKRVPIKDRIEALEQKKKTLVDNMLYVKNERKKILDDDAKAIRKRMRALEEADKKSSAEYQELVEKFKKYQTRLAPWDEKMTDYQTIMKDVEDKLTILKEKPLKVGSKDEPSTAGNWQ
ncbi:hypothetical protein [Microscilla marina]|uniref:Uncharacterized protein n=1 Tax=Microscilla marina ATCC 23134 TaxID=313606 RepID=A1ZTS3_MICM2|nr:hypothetical protein [Microscilla marina]EAY26175.1 hypothetical protein M23134_02507 [Microscilla marina ATCC 23134]